jgi:hypothetical protein
MKLSISLGQNLQCEYICQKIQKLITQHQQNGQDLSGSLLTIDIITTIDGGDNHIPKLEYNPDCTT